MKELPLTKGYKALVDDEDYERVKHHHWYVVLKPNETPYAQRYLLQKNGKRERIYLHTQIINPPPGFLVDHKDHNGLNCQRENLRLCTHTQNRQNCKVRRDSKLGYKGVFRRGKDSKSFRARIIVYGKKIYLGNHSTPEEAARAYDAAAIKYFGEFACLNFPEG